MKERSLLVFSSILEIFDASSRERGSPVARLRISAHAELKADESVFADDET